MYNDDVINKNTFSLPFVNDSINRKINYARLCHQSLIYLSTALKQRFSTKNLNFAINCPIKDPGLCFQKKIVYGMKIHNCFSPSFLTVMKPKIWFLLITSS